MALTIKPEYFEKWPAGGWKFEQALPGNLGTWHAPDPLSNSFRKQVGNVVAWRKANPAMTVKLKLSVDWDTVAGEVIAQNVARLRKMPKGDYYLIDDAPVIPSNPAQKKSLWAFVKEAGAAVVEGAVEVANGETVLQDWLGAGGTPVLPTLAEHRAGVCVVCPQNTRKHWSLAFTKRVAALFTKTIEERNKRKLSTTHDNELGACAACMCVLELKVHVPTKHIEAQTKPETWAKLDPKCWMLEERTTPA
jgi:hypothetical protein